MTQPRPGTMHRSSTPSLSALFAAPFLLAPDISPIRSEPSAISHSPDGVILESNVDHGFTSSHSGVNAHVAPIHKRTSTVGTTRSSYVATSPIDNTKRPPPFSRKVTKSLFIKPVSQRPVAPSTKQSLRALVTYSWLNVLLVCNPICWALHYTHQTPGAIFAVALMGIVPLAGILSFGTEAIAMYTGDALGGLANASLGNATEFIIAILLLVKCEIKVVQASLLGGLLSNLLLVLGMAFLVAGIRRSELEFQQTAAQLNTSLLTLAVIALVIPSAFAFALEATVGEATERSVILEMSRGSSIILIFIYISYMIFQFYSHVHYYNPGADLASATTSRSSSPAPRPHVDDDMQVARPIAHRAMSTPTGPAGVLAQTSLARAPFGSAKALGSTTPRGSSPLVGALTPKIKDAREHGRGDLAEVPAFTPRDFAAPSQSQDVEAHPMDASGHHHEEEPEMNLMVAIVSLVAATGLTYLTAEALTDSLEEIGQSGTVSPEWLGLILLAVVGNAAEHVTAVFVAYRNKVDLALAVAVGSSIQIALFVIPLLVLIGWAIGKPMSLLFDPLETLTLFLSVLLVRFATEDGRTHYMSGVALVGTYILIAFSFWYYPANGVLPEELYTC